MSWCFVHGIWHNDSAGIGRGTKPYLRISLARPDQHISTADFSSWPASLVLYKIAYRPAIPVQTRLFASFYVVVLGFYGLRQGNLFVTTNVALDLEKASEQPQAPMTLEKREEEFIHHLLDHMKNKKPYLDTDLNVAALASETGVSPEFLSGILKGHLNRNFFDFINSYRVEEFKKQVRNPANDKLSIIGIAWDCGFNSKATFNRVFRKATGLTPGEYRKQAF